MIFFFFFNKSAKNIMKRAFTVCMYFKITDINDDKIKDCALSYHFKDRSKKAQFSKAN